MKFELKEKQTKVKKKDGKEEVIVTKKYKCMDSEARILLFIQGKESEVAMYGEELESDLE